jgi:alanine dehydrogenase
MRVCDDDDVAELLALSDLLPVVEAAFLAQGRGAVERPERPHYPVGAGLDGATHESPLGTALVMPAYVHGHDHYVTKLASVHEDNPDRGLPTVNATVAVFDARTGQPEALLAGTRITNARTGCIGGLAVRELASETPVRLAVVGAGAQARWQTRAIGAAVDVADVRVYSPNSREACAADLRAEGFDATAVDSPAEAVRGATVVVTATPSTEPVFPGDALAPGALVVAVGAYTGEMRELDTETLARADLVVGDVPSEAAAVGDLADAGVDRGAVVPLSSVLDGSVSRPGPDAVVVVESVGSAVLDAATAEWLVGRAASRDVGTQVSL